MSVRFGIATFFHTFHRPMKSWQADLLIFLAALIWGVSYVFTYWGLSAAPPATLLLFRFLVGLLITLLVFGRYMFGIDRVMLRQGLILGSLFGTGYLLQSYAIQFTEISKASFITALVLPATPIVSFFVLHKRISAWNIFGVLIAICGVSLLVEVDFGNLFSSVKLGDLFALISIPFWAFYMNYIDIFTSDKEGTPNTARMLALQFCGAIPVLLAAMFLFEMNLFPQIVDAISRGVGPEFAENVKATLGKGIHFSNPNFWVSILFNGILASFALTLIQTAAQKYTTPVKAMLIFQFEPITATAVAFFLIEPYFTAWMGLGAMVIICGVLLSELGGMIFAKKAENA